VHTVNEGVEADAEVHAAEKENAEVQAACLSGVIRNHTRKCPDDMFGPVVVILTCDGIYDGDLHVTCPVRLPSAVCSSLHRSYHDDSESGSISVTTESSCDLVSYSLGAVKCSCHTPLSTLLQSKENGLMFLS
jgi:hypothetical protein